MSVGLREIKDEKLREMLGAEWFSKFDARFGRLAPGFVAELRDRMHDERVRFSPSGSIERIPDRIRHTGEQEGLHYKGEPDRDSEMIASARKFQASVETLRFPVQPKAETRYRTWPHVKSVFTDVDGVLTNGGFYYGENGLVMKKFCTRDSAAVVRLRQAGYLVFAVTHSDDRITTTRLEDMKLNGFYLGVEDKVESIKQICEEFNLVMFREAIYIDDDVGGIPAMQSVAQSFCPADAAPAVLRQGRVCDAKGGEGVLAEVADLLLKDHGG